MVVVVVHRGAHGAEIVVLHYDIASSSDSPLFVPHGMHLLQ